MNEIFRGYHTQSDWDEMIDKNGQPRSGCEDLYEAILQFSREEFEERCNERDRSFMDRGVTFSLSGKESPFPLDPIPRIITGEEWAIIDSGVCQRLKALEMFLDDVYNTGEIVLDGVIPKRLVYNSPGFKRGAFGIVPANGVRIPVAGMDIVRDDTGELFVLEDNVRTPSGASYVLENRRAMTRIFPSLLAEHNIRPVASYPLTLLSALRAQAPAGCSGTPVIVVLTPGVYNSAYFEHSFLARQMGVELVEGRDLICRNNKVYMKTTEGETKVDVVYRRVDDEYLDPLVFKPDSFIGCAGILNAARSGNVSITSAVGNSIADDKLIYTYVPEMIRYYMGEEPILRNVPTFDPQDPLAMEYIEENIENLVIKPVDASGGYGLVIGSMVDEEILRVTLEKIRSNPRGFVAQHILKLSTAPTKAGDALEPRHVDLRPFAVNFGSSISVLPGGLTRVALTKGSLVVNSSQGGGSKDTWVVDPPKVPSIWSASSNDGMTGNQNEAAVTQRTPAKALSEMDHFISVHQELKPQQEIQQQADPGSSSVPSTIWSADC